MTAPRLPRRPISMAAQQVVDEAAQRPANEAGRITPTTPELPGRNGILGTKVRERATQTGLLPHEILLKLARGEPIYQRILVPDTGEVRVIPHYPDIKTIIEAAKAAAGYYAPKLSAVQATLGISDADLDELIERLTRETATDAGATGEGETGTGQADPG